MSKFTVLLAMPDYMADGPTPWWDTFLWHGFAEDQQGAVDLARKAPKSADLADDPTDYAVVAVFRGHLVDMTPKAER